MRNLTKFILQTTTIVLLATGTACASSIALTAQSDSQKSQNTIKVENNRLTINGEPQPQIFGAEVQYFRLRGGYGPNVPRQKVIDLWNKALDRVVEAHMNAVSFYIPWDFHEYAEGKFDFTGTADEDGDGQPDYPSRDVITFIKLIKAHGITRIMVRPGPYINAEWGHLGFGAIPEWFSEKFPESHMHNSAGLRTKLVDYLDPHFLDYTKRWFTAVYNEVLKQNIGIGEPIIMLQLDNETNYQWGSLYNNDYGPRATKFYQRYLQDKYGELNELNRQHHRKWSAWESITPPTEPGKNLQEDQDWYRASDFTIYTFLQDVRKMWESLGVREPHVLFTLAESYNAPKDGVLPNYLYRNSPGRTGLMTVNLYPKTSEQIDQSKKHVLMNNPFKADLDVKAATEGGALYWGQHQEWAMGPEIQAGWWRGIDVSDQSRRQTYLTVLGHGLKAFFVYYFNEGENWGVHWPKDHVEPLYATLTQEWHLTQVPMDQRSDDFWRELQNRFEQKYVVGFDVKDIMHSDPSQKEILYFDSPLDAQAEPRGHFATLKKIGEEVIAPNQEFLARATEAYDDVALVRDSQSHVPSLYPEINSLEAMADWNGSLLGYLLNANVNPRILHGDISSANEFENTKILFHIDNGMSGERTVALLKNSLARGHVLVNLAGDALAEKLHQPAHAGHPLIVQNSTLLTAYLSKDGRLVQPSTPGARVISFRVPGPIFQYDLESKECEGILFADGQTVGYHCAGQHRTNFFQIGAPIFAGYNTSNYAFTEGIVERRLFLTALLKEAKVEANLSVLPRSTRTVAFARQDPEKKLLWVTVKTGERTAQDLRLRVNPRLLRAAIGDGPRLQIKDLLSKDVQQITISDMAKRGFRFHLDGDGSTVFVITK